MAKFKFETKEEKQRLQERAQSLKPKAPNVVATELGWAQPRPNGTLELLVSFQGLDSLLGDIDVEVTNEAPVEVNISIQTEIPAEVKITDQTEFPAELNATPTEDEEAEPVVVAPKKGGRPKKEAA